MPDTPTGAGRRERQAAARLEQILDAAARLFAERGFHRTTTRDIAAAADVAEGTLYNYFDNKDDLLFGILERLETRAGRNLADPSAPADPQQFLRRMLSGQRSQAEAVMLQAILSEILANAELRRRYADQLIAPAIDALEADLRLRCDRGQVRPLDAPALARLLTALWIGLFVLQVIGDPLAIQEWERLVDALADSLAHGLSPV